MYKKYYTLSDFIIELSSPLQIKKDTFFKSLDAFEVEAQKPDITIKHSFSQKYFLCDEKESPVYDRTPWTIFDLGDCFRIYCRNNEKKVLHTSVMSKDYKSIELFHNDSTAWENGNIETLSMYTSDQFWASLLLSNNCGFYLHSSAIEMDGFGYLFLGDSGAGKTTISKMLSPHSTILCDDRNIVRKEGGIWKVYGTWNHSEWSDTRPGGVPIKGIYFIHQSKDNKIVKITDKSLLAINLIKNIIRPFSYPLWWQKTLEIADELISDNNFYDLYFSLDQKIYDKLKEL